MIRRLRLEVELNILYSSDRWERIRGTDELASTLPSVLHPTTTPPSGQKPLRGRGSLIRERRNPDFLRNTMASISSLASPVLLRDPSSSLTTPRSSGSVLRSSVWRHDRITSRCSTSCGGSRKGALRLVCAVSQEAAVSADTSSGVARRLYVGNIPRTVTNDELAAVFGEHGAVEKAEVMYDKYSGRSRRFGFVNMSTVEDASAAAEKLDGSEIGGRKIKVNVTEKPLQTVDTSLLQSDDTTFVDSPYKVYVGNLAKTVTTEILTDLFSEKGKVLGAKVSRVPGTSKSSGFGFVSFSSEEDVEAAITTFNNKFLEGQRIRVNKA